MKQLNILHVLSSPASGGAEVYVRDLAHHLKKNGASPHIAFVSRAADIGRGLDFERTYLRSLDDWGIPYHFIGHKTKKRPWLGAYRLRNLVKRHQIDICHSHLMYGIVFSTCLPVPVVYTHHSIIANGNPFQYALFNRIVNRYVGISDVCGKELAKYTNRPVTTIFNGVDQQRMIVSSNRSYRDNTLKIISVGRLAIEKNYPLLIQSISLLPDHIRRSIEVEIVGEGDASIKCIMEQRIQELGLQDQIRLLGNRKDVAELLAQSHLFVMSSDWEGLPIALLEAATASLPCVVTNVGGCSEIVEACDNGKIVQPNDPSQMAAAIASMLENREELERLSNNAKENSKKFSIEYSCRKHLDLYKEVLGEV